MNLRFFCSQHRSGSLLRGFFSLSCLTLMMLHLALWSAPVQRPPNVILIMADDLGYGDLGCYGQTHFQTPRLDQMAQEGVRFTDFYSGSTVCAPSRCTLLTGFHTGRARVRGNGSVPLDYGDLTLAEIFKKRGYKTCAVGKWGLGEAGSTGIPTIQGFDDWVGFLNQGRAHEHYPEFLWRNQEAFVVDKNAHGQKGEYAHYLFTKVAINFINLHKKDPFFLYLPLTLPHKHVEAPTQKPYQDKDWPDPQKTLAAMIYRLDRSVGQILDLLDSLKLSENTLVIFTSDNGPHNQEGVDPAFFRSSGPFRGIKRDLYEGGIRVPMILRWKGTLPPGQVSKQVWAAWDLFPTLGDWVGEKAPRGIDGVSLARPILQGKNVAHPPLYWEFHEGGFHQAARIGNWKAVRHGAKSPLELYDLEGDPGEATDVAADNRSMVQRMEAWLAEARTPSDKWPVPDLDP